MDTHDDTAAGADRELTPLEEALAAVATDKSLIDDFYDVLLASEVVVGTRGTQSGTEGAEDDLIVIMDEKNTAHLPVFASDAAMDVWDGADKVGRVTIPVADLVSGLERDMRVVLNPGLGITKVFDDREIRMLRRMARRQSRQSRQEELRKVQVAFSPVTRIPDDFYTRLSAAVSGRRTLKAIYIVDVEDKERPAGHYMLVLIDIRPSDFEPAGEQLVDTLSDLFEEGTPVEMACLQSEAMWADLVADHNVPPIFPRAH